MSIAVDQMGNPITDLEDQVVPPGTDVSYFQTKVAEFQALMTDLDATASAIMDLRDLGIQDTELDAALGEFDAKKSSFRTAAEALNFAVNGLNKFGANLPTVAIPTGLGFLPAVPIAALAAVSGAIAVVATLIVWGKEWISGVNERAKVALALSNITDPQQRAQAAAAIAKIAATNVNAQSSPLSSIANIVKWVAIAAVAYFAYSAYQKTR
jgi:hypothetical protein